MVLYRVVRAFPLIFCLLVSPLDSLDIKIFLRGFLVWGLRITFLVKMPLFGVHLWLPKAHVEAPSLGSIVLAGLLLKLGSWGLLNLGDFIITQTSILWGLAYLGMLGGRLVATCQRDRKSLVAYSSVCHINFIVLIFLIMPCSIKATRVIIIFAHGVTSSFMFWITGVIFYLKYSRQLLFLGGILGIRSSLGILTTVLFFTNFGVPPSITFFQESSFIIFLVGLSFPTIFLVGGYLIVVCYYSLYYLNLFSLSHSSRKRRRVISERVPLWRVLFSFNVLLLTCCI